MPDVLRRKPPNGTCLPPETASVYLPLPPLLSSLSLSFSNLEEKKTLTSQLCTRRNRDNESEGIIIHLFFPCVLITHIQRPLWKIQSVLWSRNDLVDEQVPQRSEWNLRAVFSLTPAQETKTSTRAAVRRPSRLLTRTCRANAAGSFYPFIPEYLLLHSRPALRPRVPGVPDVFLNPIYKNSNSRKLLPDL